MEQREFYEYLGETRSKTLNESEQYRVHRTLAVFPQDARSVIDIASGDGRLARHLLDADLVVQCDISIQSLLAASGNRIQSDVACLPFADRSFDLAMCCEGLEHFPEDVFNAARREIVRVADSKILISVPFEEDLIAKQTRCASCGYVFHKWGHLRRFTMKTLSSLFPGFTLHRVELFGKSSPFQFSFVQRINQRYGHRYAEPSPLTICPKCNARSFDMPPRNVFSVTMGMINRVTTRLIPTGHHNWSAAVYVRV